MYLSTATITGITIALGSSILLIILTAIANDRLQRDNKFLKSRLRQVRKQCEQEHTKVPF
jgi:hypothetical protein